MSLKQRKLIRDCEGTRFGELDKGSEGSGRPQSRKRSTSRDAYGSNPQKGKHISSLGRQKRSRLLRNAKQQTWGLSKRREQADRLARRIDLVKRKSLGVKKGEDGNAFYSEKHETG